MERGDGPRQKSWLLYALLFASIMAGGIASALGPGLGIIFLAISSFIGLFLLFSMLFAHRRNSDDPLPTVPSPPLVDSATLEGRVDRMAIEEEEVMVNAGTKWEAAQMATVYVIVIGGLRYTLDPVPVKRGRYDWVNEGMRVRATFDRKTRIIYDLEWVANAPYH